MRAKQPNAKRLVTTFAMTRKQAKKKYKEIEAMRNVFPPYDVLLDTDDYNQKVFSIYHENKGSVVIFRYGDSDYEYFSAIANAIAKELSIQEIMYKGWEEEQ